MTDRPDTPTPRLINEARIDEIQQTWGSAADDTLREMLEDLRVVVEDDVDNWEPGPRDRARDLALLIAAQLPDTAEPEPQPDRLDTAGQPADPSDETV